MRDAALGRSHRASIGKNKLAEVINLSKEILEIPADWKLGIVPASDTGAIEMALWSLLGARGVDVLAWESFGSTWGSDCKKQLKLADLRIITPPACGGGVGGGSNTAMPPLTSPPQAGGTNQNSSPPQAGGTEGGSYYGKLPDLSRVNWSRDVVFTWNGTTSGVRVPNADWIPANREGLAICDATSAVFAMKLPWDKLDVVTWSWQKVLGGEAAHGMIALSPRAVARLESYTPAWPLPKIFQMTKGGKLIEGIFKGETINTPSMLCVEDQLDALKWAKSIGGLDALVKRSEANLASIAKWVEVSDWADFLAEDKSTRSCTSICLKIVDGDYQSLSPEAQAEGAKQIAKMLEKEGVAYDIGAYRDAPAGLRIWGGATVENADIEALLPWLDWAWAEVKAGLKKAA